MISRNNEEGSLISTESNQSAKDIAKQLAETMQCNCNLDNWEPEKSTGHSWVCRIHKLAIEKWGDIQNAQF